MKKRVSKEPTWTAGVEYPGIYYNARDLDVRRVAKQFGGKETGSGYNFLDQTRDMSFEFSSQESANKFYEASRKKRLINKAKFIYPNGD